MCIRDRLWEDPVGSPSSGAPDGQLQCFSDEVESYSAERLQDDGACLRILCCRLAAREYIFPIDELTPEFVASGSRLLRSAVCSISLHLRHCQLYRKHQICTNLCQWHGIA